jgi:hypothetical protein
MTLRLAQVVQVYPGLRAVDLVFLDTGAVAARVKVASLNAFSDGGSWSLPSVEMSGIDEAGGVPASGRSMTALVGTVHGKPIVVGFMASEGHQMAFAEDDREVHRHPSGTYVTIAPDGSVEISHPSGAYLRLGSGDRHEDLSAKSADGNWAIPGAGENWPTLVFETRDIRLTAADGEVVLAATKRIRLAAGQTALELRDDGTTLSSPQVEVAKA